MILYKIHLRKNWRFFREKIDAIFGLRRRNLCKSSLDMKMSYENKHEDGWYCFYFSTGYLWIYIPNEYVHDIAQIAQIDQPVGLVSKVEGSNPKATKFHFPIWISSRKVWRKWNQFLSNGLLQFFFWKIRQKIGNKVFSDSDSYFRSFDNLDFLFLFCAIFVIWKQSLPPNACVFYWKFVNCSNIKRHWPKFHLFEG